MSLIVKLDSSGRVVGTAPGPAYGSWIEAPLEVAADPMSYLREADGAWRRMTADERVQRDRAHS